MNNEEKNKGRNMFLLVLGILVCIGYLIITGPLARNQALAPLKGVFAQIQVVFTVIMVVTNQKRGFIISLIMNGLGLLFSFNSFLHSHDPHTLTGVVIPIITSLSLSVIYGNQIRSRKMRNEISNQYQELVKSSHAMHDKDEELRKLAYNDSLTGIYNKAYFQKQVDEALRLSKPFTIIYIDIDNFKAINDSCGPKTGDAALIAYADRLQKYCGRKYIVARTNGDEFGLLITQTEQTEADILNITEKLRQLFGEPLNIQGTMLSVTVSCGIVASPRDGNATELLLDNAIMATYTAKANGKDRPCFFSQAI